MRSEFSDSWAVAGIQSYLPYGEVTGVSGTLSSPFAFTGEMLDGNGLQYHRARYYDPALGVWNTQDFLETPNRYNYVGGNPVNWVDPTGLQKESVTVDSFRQLVEAAARAGRAMCGDINNAVSCLMGLGFSYEVSIAAAPLIGGAGLGTTTIIGTVWWAGWQSDQWSHIESQLYGGMSSYFEARAWEAFSPYQQSILPNPTNTNGIDWEQFERYQQSYALLQYFSQTTVGTLNPTFPNGFDPGNEFWRLCNAGLCDSLLALLLSQLLGSVPIPWSIPYPTSPNPEAKLYRGTRRYSEISAWQLTGGNILGCGLIMSDAVRQMFLSGFGLGEGILNSIENYTSHVSQTGSLDELIREHARFGATEFTDRYGGDRALISLTSDRFKAREFAKDGLVFEISFEIAWLAGAMPQTLETANEGEWVVPHVIPMCLSQE